MERITALAVILLFLVGCGGGGSGKSTPAPSEDAFAESARAATNRLRVALKSELSAAMQSGGPLAALVVCKMRASEIAADVSADTGYEVGRLASRNRNPENAAGPAEAAVLAEFEARPAFQDTVITIDGHATYLRAIRIDTPACLKCHGPTESIDPGVLGQIAELYPDDRATGFAPGDLRGAFVVR